jgi:hypothetical protein
LRISAFGAVIAARNSGVQLRSMRKIMSYGAKKLTGSDLPGSWSVKVTYGDGSSPTAFTVEELEDIDERIALGPDWVIITLNRHPPEPVPESEAGA